MTNTRLAAAAAIGTLLLGGCAYPNAGSRDYRGYEVRGEQSVRFGVVESVRDVRINPRETGVGTAGGAPPRGPAGRNGGGGERANTGAPGRGGRGGGAAARGRGGRTTARPRAEGGG